MILNYTTVRATLETEGSAQASQGRSKDEYIEGKLKVEKAYLAKGDPKRTL